MSTTTFVENVAPFAEYSRGFPRVVRRGDTLPDDDPLVRKYPNRFKALGRQVEQATSAPGETRRVRIPTPDEPEGVAVPDELVCKIDDCGFAAKSDHGLRIHQAKSH